MISIILIKILIICQHLFLFNSNNNLFALSKIISSIPIQY